MQNFTLKITSARALIKARLKKGPAISKVENNKGLGYKTSKYGIYFFRTAMQQNRNNYEVTRVVQYSTPLFQTCL